MTIYEKYYEYENIQPGDLISLEPITGKVQLSCNKFLNKDKNIIGVCKSVTGNTIEVVFKGITDVNVIGNIGLGDRLTSSEEKGKAKAIRYGQDVTQFNVPVIGKVIGIYNVYNKAKVLLDIE